MRSVHLVVRWGTSVLVAGDFAPRADALRAGLERARCGEIGEAFEVDARGDVHLGGQRVPRDGAVSEHVGPFSVEASLSSEEPSLFRQRKRKKLPLAGALVSLLVHGGLVLSYAAFDPALEPETETARSEDRAALVMEMHSDVSQAAPQPSHAAQRDAGAASGELGTGAATSGRPTTPRATSHTPSAPVAGPSELDAAGGNAPTIDPSTFGMIGLLASRRDDPLASAWSDPFGGSRAADPSRSMWQDAIGESFSVGGLGLSGFGPGGGSGVAGGIGLGRIGTIGHGDAGGEANLFGHKPERDYGSTEGHIPRPPLMRSSNDGGLTGRLPAEAIQRIVRQNFGRIRLCYESGLTTHPELEGRVVVTFVVAPDGSVASTNLLESTWMRLAGSQLPNQIGSCVARVFAGMSFPASDSGTVLVTYPIAFSPVK